MPLPEQAIVVEWLLDNSTNMEEVLRIDRQCYLDVLTERRFQNLLRKGRVYPNVARGVSGKVVGYSLMSTICSEEREWIRIVRVGVAVRYMRQGVGTALVQTMEEQAVLAGYSRLVADVRESNTVGQLFLKSLGFHGKYRQVTYADTGERGYRFLKLV